MGSSEFIGIREHGRANDCRNSFHSNREMKLEKVNGKSRGTLCFVFTFQVLFHWVHFVMQIFVQGSHVDQTGHNFAVQRGLP